MSERLSRRTKFLYGIGDTGFSLTATIVALLCVGIAFAIFYPMGCEGHAEIRRELESRRAGRAEEAV